jgi:hypothetical protein
MTVIEPEINNTTLTAELVALQVSRMSLYSLFGPAGAMPVHLYVDIRTSRSPTATEQTDKDPPRRGRVFAACAEERAA